MKSLVALTTMFLLLMSLGCGRSFEKEAVKRAREEWQLTQLGGSYYICQTSAETHLPGFDARASKTVFELRDIKLEVSPRSLSEADKLNGLEWGGLVHLKVSAYRRYAPQPYFGEQPSKTWSDWISGGPAPNTSDYIDAMQVTKMKDEWEVVPLSFRTGPNVTFKQVERSDLPR